MTFNSGIRRSLEDRVILCADCDATRTLSLSTGNLVCSTCGSDNWMFVPVTAYVKRSVSIKGELKVEEDLTIEGLVEGRIELQNHNLWIGPNGKAYAEIHAKSVIIAGNVIGDIFASEMVEIKLSGSVAGSITCPRVSLVEGARFKGRVDTEAQADTTLGVDSPKAESAKTGHGPSSGRVFSKS